MLTSPRYRSWSRGTPEYILVKAGLFQADDLGVRPTDKLTRLLNPLPDELLPILIEMAWVGALELGGAIDTHDRRSRIVGQLHKLGLRHEQIGGLFVAVGKGAAEAAEEWRRNRPELMYM